MIAVRVLLGIGFIFVLSGCAKKHYMKQESAFIVFKTPTLKHADLGFIYENNDTLKVELYSVGQVLMSFEITSQRVCMSMFECMSKAQFNTQVLVKAYPKDILDNIFRAKEIFGGLYKSKIRNGFTQKIKKDKKYNISYMVLKKKIIFRDIINGISIKITKGRE